MSIFSKLRLQPLIIVVLAFLLSTQCAQQETEPLRLFAAASTSDLVHALAQEYQRKTGLHVQGVFASSSILARQIEAGAPADLFLSANHTWVDYLDEKALVKQHRPFLENRLVLISEKNKPFQWPTCLNQVPRIALGDPSHVPAGIYAQKALEELGLWTSLQGKTIPAQDVRAALRLVLLGEADLGIVYQSDVTGVAVDIIHIFDVTFEIQYSLAQIQAHPKMASFLAFLDTEAAEIIIRKYGFQL